ncbi:50S ribosomal protein L10 [Smittium culicis]|uniref:50S ribosomal protein L10 n=1 Tax=Smittium culicis TaxID=133412 RepID=A0A1R1Y6U8_9FUNG|nr:50S ribosomal protein L10 [Smittium culicis]
MMKLKALRFNPSISSILSFQRAAVGSTRNFWSTSQCLSQVSVSNSEPSSSINDSFLLPRSKPKLTVTKFNKPFSNRKQVLFERYEAMFSQSPAILVIQYINLPAESWTELRHKLKIECHGAEATVLKGGIAAAVVRGTPLDRMKFLFTGSVFTISWPIASQSPTYVNTIGKCPGEFALPAEVKKVLEIVSSYSQKLVPLGGMVDNALLTHKMIKDYTNTPSQHELLSQVVGILQNPASSLTRTLNHIPSRLVNVLKNMHQQ